MDIQQNANHFRYLFDLQASGRTNMLGAGRFLETEQGLSRSEAKEVLLHWIANYDVIAKELNIET